MIFFLLPVFFIRKPEKSKKDWPWQLAYVLICSYSSYSSFLQSLCRMHTCISLQSFTLVFALNLSEVEIN